MVPRISPFLLSVLHSAVGNFMKNSTCCSWRIAPAADGALPCHKKGEVVSFQVSGIPLEPDGSVEADRLHILVDVQDAP